MIKYLIFEQYIYDLLDNRHINAQTMKINLKRGSLDRHQRLELLANYAIEKTKEANLGLIIGQRITNTSYGILGHALIHCENLLASQRLLLKHLWVWQKQAAQAFSLDVNDETVTLNYLSPPQWRHNQHFIVDLFFSSNIKRSRELLENNMPGTYLNLKRPKPADAQFFTETLKMPVHFDQAYDQLVLPKALTESPMTAAFLIHSPAYQRHCEKLLNQMQTGQGLTEQIRFALVHGGNAKLKAPEMSKKLNMSERNLRRRLAQEQTSYREIQKQIQYHLAQAYLADTSLSIAEIANLAGYYDTPTFTRAFKKWAKQTPAEYRRAGL